MVMLGVQVKVVEEVVMLGVQVKVVGEVETSGKHHQILTLRLSLIFPCYFHDQYFII